MLKDPLSRGENAYDVFRAALKAQGDTHDPADLTPRELRRTYGVIRRERSAGFAAKTLAEVRQPERRLALDIWDLHWTPEAPGSPQREAQDLAQEMRGILINAGASGEIEPLTWTDLDRADWSEDFMPLRPCPKPGEDPDAELNELDPQNMLDPPDPGF